MNKKKLITIGAVLLTASLTYGQSRATIERGLLGAVMGGVIGNNVGDGDSETGAIIGGLSAIIFGEKGISHRRSHTRSRHHTYGHSRHIPSVKLYPSTKVIEIREQVWVPGRTIRNACGDVIYHEPGHYETHSRFETIRVFR
jgi:hypothetical protein